MSLRNTSSSLYFSLMLNLVIAKESFLIALATLRPLADARDYSAHAA